MVALFLENIALIAAFLACETVINLTIFRQLDNQLTRLQNRLLTVWHVHFERLVQEYFANHTERVLFSMTVNDDVFGPANVAFFVTNVLSYIYLPVYMIFCPLAIFYRIVIVIVCASQTAGPLFMIANILLTNTHMIKSKGLLRILSHYRLLSTKDVRCIRLKWAMASYYELLTNKTQPLTLKAGFLGNLTKGSVMKVEKTFSKCFKI